MEKMQVQGVWWFILHCLIFACIATITKHLQTHLPIFEIIFFQVLVGTCVLTPMFLKTWTRHTMQRKKMVFHFIRALCWVIATAIFFYSMHFMSVSKAIALSFTCPLFTTIFAVLFFKETLRLPRIIALLCGFLGMIVIVKPGMEGFEPESLYILGACLLWAMTDVLIKLVGKTEKHSISTWYFSAMALICTIPFIMSDAVLPHMNDYFWLIILGGLFALNMLSVTIAYSKADFTIMMPFSFSQLIFTAFLAFFVFDEMVQTNTVLGSLIIVLSTSFMAYRERKINKELLAYAIADELS